MDDLYRGRGEDDRREARGRERAIGAEEHAVFVGRGGRCPITALPRTRRARASAPRRYAAGTREILECRFEANPSGGILILDAGKLVGSGARSYSQETHSQAQGRLASQHSVTRALPAVNSRSRRIVDPYGGSMRGLAYDAGRQEGSVWMPALDELRRPTQRPRGAGHGFAFMPVLPMVMAAVVAIVSLSVGAVVAGAMPSAGASAKHRKAHHKKKHKNKGKKPGATGSTIKVKGGSVTLTFTSQAWSKLSSSVGNTFSRTTTPIAPATATSSGAFTFPLTSGSLNSATGRGSVSASGGLTVASSTNVAGLFGSSSSATANSPVLAIGATSTLTMTSENFTPPTVPLLDLSTSAIKPHGSGAAITLSNIPATLTAPGQQFFGSSFHAGEEIATVTIQATG